VARIPALGVVPLRRLASCSAWLERIGITASTPPFRLMEIACQASYPLNSEKASPPGTFTVYLSCAEIPIRPKTASHTAAIPIINMLWRFIAAPPSRFGASRLSDPLAFTEQRGRGRPPWNSSGASEGEPERPIRPSRQAAVLRLQRTRRSRPQPDR